MKINIKADVSKGLYTRTRYNNSFVELLPNPVITSFVGDSNYWAQKNGAWSISEDKATMNNTNSGSYYLQLTYNLEQDASTTYPVFFRIKAKGVNISGTENYNDFGIQLRATFTDAGLGGGSYEEVNVAFPSGTWDERHFSVIYTPTQPVRYIYAYIFARDKVGQITVWDAEIIELKDNDIGLYGAWESEVIDLYKINNKSITENKISLEKIAFKYGDVDNVNNFYSSEYSKNYLSNFDYIVVEDPTRLATREIEITDYLKDKGVKIFGYTYIGWSENYIALTDSQLKSDIDEMSSQGWYGVFLDMAGNDYNVTRDYLNTYVDYAHSKGLKVFANAWNVPDILSSDIDATYNPSGVSTSLGSDDWVLLESFYSRGDDLYAGEKSGGWQKYINKYIDSVNLAKPLGVKVATLADKFSFVEPSDSKDLTNSYNLALICGADAWSYGTTDYTNKDIPLINYGNSFSGDVVQASENRWERETDRGTIWFEGSGNIVDSGSFSTVEYLDAKKEKIDNVNFSNAGSVKTKWYTSSDKVNWIEWTDNLSPNRYVKAKAILIK